MPREFAPQAFDAADGVGDVSRHRDEFLHRLHRSLTTLGVFMTQPRLLRLTALSALAVAFSLIAPAGAANAGPTAGGCRVSDLPEQTVEILRFHCDQSQLDMLYRPLPPGPMPQYGAKARGYWRWYPDAQGLDEPGNRLMNLLVWQGKTLYTREAGGHMMNPVVPHPGRVRPAWDFAQ